ncbi:hypothetical protein J6P59_04950 [bacterium]|nr:hypothetical protein [bacterium]MBO7044187.1 hypothetical protein [bacterium]
MMFLLSSFICCLVNLVAKNKVRLLLSLSIGAGAFEYVGKLVIKDHIILNPNFNC